MVAKTPAPFPIGLQMMDGSAMNAALAADITSSEDGITATAAGNQATARLLTAVLNRLSVVATNGDSVKLPLGLVSGQYAIIINDGVANAQVYGSGTDTIDAVATATGVTLSAGKRGFFWCLTPGLWQSMAGAKSS